MRCCLFAAWLCGLTVFISSASLASPGNGAAGVPALDVQLLPPSGGDASVGSVTSGAVDSRFSPFAGYKAAASAETLWFRVGVRPAAARPDNAPAAGSPATGASAEGAPAAAASADGPAPAGSNPGIPVLIARGGWFEHIEAFPAAGTAGVDQPIPHATELREFGGAHDSVFILPDGALAGQPLYLRVATQRAGPIRCASH